MASIDSSPFLIALDVGNSRIKLGRFERLESCATAAAAANSPLPIAGPALPEPSEILELPLTDRSGHFDVERLAAWCDTHVPVAAEWLVCSVHRGAADAVAAAVDDLGQSRDRTWPLRRLSHRDVKLAIEVDSPERVGVDRLMAAVAAERLRGSDRAAVVVDLGTAITVDLVTPAGAFAGGAILPGLAMSAQALEEQTDALPHVPLDHWQRPPAPLGKSTVPAIEAGLFWGTVGAVRELIGQLSAGCESSPDVFLTGGHAPLVATALANSVSWTVRHVPHLVLAGIAIVGRYESSC